MLKNYLIVALRNIKKHKGYAFINILGFAIGLTCCVLITLFIFDELSYDQFYPNSERIYRVVNYAVVHNRIDHTARSSPPLAKVLAEEFPEVEAVTKCRNYGFPVLRYQDKVFSEERVFSVDPTFFDVFQVPFIQGDPESALQQPDAIVITQSMARKYFGNEDPIGKLINSDQSRDYIVTAVIEDTPKNSHFQFDFLRSLQNNEDVRSPVWVFNDFYTYILLKESSDLTKLETKLYNVVKERIDPFLKMVMGLSIDEFLAGGGAFKYYLQPLTDIHLHSHLDFEIEPNGDILYVYILATIAAGILLIACINFINLATARSVVRVREIGIRKTVGSTYSQIMSQFLTETIIMTILAVAISWLFADLVLPLFNQLTGKDMTLPLFSYWWVMPLSLIFAVLIGILAGFYPAFFLASFRPVKVLQGWRAQESGRSKLRTGLVIFQFAISIILIIATLTIRQQLQYIQDKDLGFNKDQIVIIHKTDDLGRHLETFKKELLQFNGILSASNSADLFGNPIEVAALTPEGQTEDKAKIISYMTVDHDFLVTYGISLKEGRFFEEKRSTDRWQLVMNEAAVKAMDLKEPVGKTLINSLFPDNRYPVIGVVEDFHFQSLRQRIEPMVFAPFNRQPNGRYISVRIQPQAISGTLAHIENTWKKFSGGQPFEYEFFDDHFSRIYLAEQRTELIFLVFAILAIIIACLGLFGLSAFIAERRTKEVGVRKVLGSSTGKIVILVIGQFLKWVIIANIIAWPLAWYMMNLWLTNFVYRISPNWDTFLFAGIIALFLSTVTIAWQAIRAAVTNPVKALRYE